MVLEICKNMNNEVCIRVYMVYVYYGQMHTDGGLGGTLEIEAFFSPIRVCGKNALERGDSLTSQGLGNAFLGLPRERPGAHGRWPFDRDTSNFQMLFLSILPDFCRPKT